MVYGVCGMLIKAEVCVDDGRMVVAARHAHDGRPHHAIHHMLHHMIHHMIHHMLHHMLQHMLIKRHCYLSALRELSRHAARHDMQQQDMTCSSKTWHAAARHDMQQGGVSVQL
jgi:hypothetical protein